MTFGHPLDLRPLLSDGPEVDEVVSIDSAKDETGAGLLLAIEALLAAGDDAA